jgi:hypothetical protein
VPGDTLTVTGASSVGTEISVPSTASAMPTFDRVADRPGALASHSMIARLLGSRLQAALFGAVAAILHAAPAPTSVLAQIQEKPATTRRVRALAHTLA